jgi:hypothetical protein
MNLTNLKRFQQAADIEAIQAGLEDVTMGRFKWGDLHRLQNLIKPIAKKWDILSQ